MSSRINPEKRVPFALFQNVLIFAGNLPFAARVSKSWSCMAKHPQTERLFYKALFQAYMRTPSLNLYARRSLVFWKEEDKAHTLVERTIKLVWKEVLRIEEGLQCIIKMPTSLDPFSPTQITKAAKQVEDQICQSSLLFFEKLAIVLPAARKRHVTLKGTSLQKAIDIRTWCEENRALLANVQSLSLREVGLTLLPPEIVFFSNLEKLDLSNNFLTSLPPEIARLFKLTNLSLRNNMFASLPREVCYLENLEVLVASHNLITWIPQEMGRLRKLTVLHLEGNNFTDFPSAVCNLPSLLELNLAMNQMVEVSESISNLRSLVNLFLNDNRICYLPAGIAALNALMQLDVRANNQDCFAAQELLTSDNPAIQNALLAARLYDSSEPVISIFSTSLFRSFISWLSNSR